MSSDTLSEGLNRLRGQFHFCTVLRGQTPQSGVGLENFQSQHLSMLILVDLGARSIELLKMMLLFSFYIVTEDVS